MISINNKLIADDGMTLTNGDAFGKCVYLAAGDTSDNWQEITDAEAETLKRDRDVMGDEMAEKARAYDILMGVEE